MPEAFRALASGRRPSQQEKLCELLKNLKLGVTTKMVEEVSIEAAWFAQI